jgi:predicted nucleotidyltransferase
MYSSPSDITGMLAPIFAAYNIRRAVLFGSCARGEDSPTSDIDILVDSDLKGLDFVELIEDIRTAAEREIDLFDVRHITQGSALDREIQKTGVVIYEE